MIELIQAILIGIGGGVVSAFIVIFLFSDKE